MEDDGRATRRAAARATRALVLLCSLRCYCALYQLSAFTKIIFSVFYFIIRLNYFNDITKNAGADLQFTSQMVANYIICTYRKSAVKTFKLVDGMTLRR